MKTLAIGGIQAGFALFALLPFGAASPACAGPLTAGDFLVSDGSQHAIYEYTPGGRRVQTIAVPPTLDAYNRGIAVDGAGEIQVFNGTFTPTLSTFDPATGAWVHHSYPGWSTIGSLYFGGVATYRDFVYVTDAYTPNGGEPNGIVRFNRSDYSAQRFASGLDFGYITMGRDGRLYALAGTGSPAGSVLYVLNPLSMAVLWTITLPVETRGIAVDAAGHIFAPGALSDRNIYEFDRTGQILKRLNTHARFLNDIALSADGQLVVGDANGNEVFVTDVSLSELGAVQTEGGGSFVAWVPEPVSEPAGWALLALGALGLFAYTGGGLGRSNP
ncbi:MAG TPA: hypothetical protein VKU02_26940 [Gemmataceae bacterium]|nr:hypothetical protein [Gemmataceae bacterium]